MALLLAAAAAALRRFLPPAIFKTTVAYDICFHVLHNEWWRQGIMYTMKVPAILAIGGRLSWASMTKKTFHHYQKAFGCCLWRIFKSWHSRAGGLIRSDDVYAVCHWLAGHAVPVQQTLPNQTNQTSGDTVLPLPSCSPCYTVTATRLLPDSYSSSAA
jgi:hypothetical protein